MLYNLAVIYSARNIINDDHVALKLETVVDHSSSLEHEYWMLKQLEESQRITALVLELLGPSLHQLFLANNQRFSLLNVVNLGVQLLSCLEYIHSHNYVHGDIKLQNILVGLGNLRHTAFIIDFGITKTYWNATTSDHVSFCHGRSLSGTPAFASINNHLGVDLCATLPAPATCMLDFSQPDGSAIHPLLLPDQCCVAKARSPCPPETAHRLTRV
ncbi:kinase-like domain-containing protein [Suillus subalutaceus]|uniref:kinase-like domain-containing protein n=1 Tax=Suillus subalutaceus TaxID=48586 RepID=UPI001B87EDE9|nr:kinase-like domain-containing protein [Suillus subalutaceus]KAG1842976.1 kinase-like domain-containing protein [Suillus subalutaceus]